MDMDGGKKRKQTKTKRGGKEDKDGGAIELGSILTPMVLYGLRQAMTPSKKTRRGGASNSIFVSQPAPLDGGAEDVLSSQLPNLAAQVPQEGGKRRKGKRGGGLGLSFASQPAPVQPEAEILFPGQKPLLPADGGDLTKPVEAGALVPSDATGGVLEGGKRKYRKARKGGDKDKKDDQEGGKRKARKGGNGMNIFVRKLYDKVLTIPPGDVKGFGSWDKVKNRKSDVIETLQVDDSEGNHYYDVEISFYPNKVYVAGKKQGIANVDDTLFVTSDEDVSKAFDVIRQYTSQQDGGKRKARKGGDKDSQDKQDDQEGGKRRKARKGGKKDDDDDQEGGKRRKARKGGKKDDDDEQEGGKKRKGGKKDDNDEQDGGKRKRKLTRGGALELFTKQIEEVTNQLNRLMEQK